MRPLSHSSISMYTECPQRYKFKYVDKLPEKPKSYFSFGKSVHAELEFFYNIPALPPPTLDQILTHYKQIWISEGYKDAEQEQENYDEGERILRGFHKKHIADFKLPLFAEYRFNIKVDGVPVIGFVDRIDKVDGGKMAIIDYKTGKSFEKGRVLTDPQLTMYQMACEELLGMPVESLTFYHLNSLKPHSTEPHTKDQVKVLRERVVTVADSIERGKFEPDPEERKCSWCDFKPHCPVFRDHYAPAASLPFASPISAAKPARAPAPLFAGTKIEGLSPVGSAVDAPLFAAAGAGAAVKLRPEDDEELAELVDRYGKLADEVSRRQAEADQLAGALMEKLEAKGLVRAFGSAYEATLSTDEKWEFQDKAKVLDVIRKSGHWEDILSPSGPLVQKLMNSSFLPPELRKRLEALGKKVGRPNLQVKRTE